jgi:hypothetical protein
MPDTIQIVAQPPAQILVAASGPQGVQGPEGTLPQVGAGLLAADNLGGYVARSIVSLAAALTVANANAVAADVTLDLADNLKAAAAVAAAGYVKRDAFGDWSAAASVPWADLSNVPATFAPSAHSHAWSDITATPTTIAGYGIADAYTKTQADARYQPAANYALASTTLAGYGIADAYTKVQADARYQPAGNYQAAGNYALVGASYTTAQADARFAPIAVPWASITGTPTTLAGYGIADAYTKAAADARFLGINATAANASQLLGGTWAVPGAIGATTPASGVFTSLGANGNVTVASGGHIGVQIAGNDVATLGASAVANSYFGYNAYFDGAAWQRADATRYSVLNQLQGTAGAGTFQIYTSAPAANPVANWNLLFQVDSTSGAQFLGAGSLPGSTGWLSTGEIGVRIAAATDRSLYIGAPSSNAANLYGAFVNATSPATATGLFYGFRSVIASAAAAYTLGDLSHFVAFSGTKGAGSTITTVRGFYAANAIAVGTSNYAFYSDLNSATNTWAFYSTGTAESFLKGPLNILATGALSSGNLLGIGASALHPSTGTVVRGGAVDFTSPTTATSTAGGFSTILRSSASAYTLTQVQHYLANQTVLGAGSTISTVFGFYANSPIVNDVAGCTSYAFYSSLNKGANGAVFQLYMAGTAPSVIASELYIGRTGSVGAGEMISLAMSAQSLAGNGTGADKIGITIRGNAAASAVSNVIGVQTYALGSNASAITLANLAHFYAQNSALGAGSTISAVYGFRVDNQICVGTNNYAFHSNVANAANTFQVYMAGTAPSVLGGTVTIGPSLAITTSEALRITLPSPMTAASLTPVNLSITAPATATAALSTIFGTFATAASAFTLAS